MEAIKENEMIGKRKESIKFGNSQIEVYDDDIYPFAVEQTRDSNPASGNRFKRTEAKARKIKDADRDEVQIEICISEVKWKSNRLYEHYTSFTLPTRIAKMLADVINGEDSRS